MIKNSLFVSFIIIGQNSARTLEKCLRSIILASETTLFINNLELIYVDSKSSDNSLKIAEKYGAKIIEITDGYTSASLGRHLGLKHSIYSDILFIDADMELEKNWFNNCIDYYHKYGAIHGDRYEKIYLKNVLVKEIENFYQINTLEKSDNIGGCFMVKRRFLGNCNFRPRIKDEEERDIYAQFLKNGEVYRLPFQMFVHNNYKDTNSKILTYFRPFSKIGYLISKFYSIKYGYFLNYCKIQKFYLLSIFLSFIFYGSFIFMDYRFSLLSVVMLRVLNKKYFIGACATMLFFPYKFIMAIIFWRQRLYYSYNFELRKYSNIKVN
jgi:glycosyltransferase involved in cell wall biosynthesis